MSHHQTDVTGKQTTYKLNMYLRSQKIPPGKGMFIFDDHALSVRRSLRVYYFRPTCIQPNTPILFVLHGGKRNANRYRNEWAELASSHRALLVAPQFSHEEFAGAQNYNLGNLCPQDDELTITADSSFMVIERLFDHLKQEMGIDVDRYLLYGHSAGAQFVHRLVLFHLKARVKVAVSANAGWYTLPTLETSFPYGLRDTGYSGTMLCQALRRRLVILLGDRDIDHNKPNLRRTPGANAQGINRLQRGFTAFAAARRTADQLGEPCRWQCRLVQGAGHSNRQMCPDAAKILFDNG